MQCSYQLVALDCECNSLTRIAFIAPLLNRAWTEGAANLYDPLDGCCSKYSLFLPPTKKLLMYLWSKYVQY